MMAGKTNVVVFNAPGPQGKPGPRGPAGAKGDTGAAGLSPKNSTTPEAYQAAGNGTTDDTSKLQQALDALGLIGGGALLLGAATYLITTLTFNYPNLSIIGAGAASVLKSTSNNPLIVAQKEGSTFKDFTMSGNNAGSNQDGVRSWVASSGVVDWTASGVRATGLGGTAFYIYNGGATYVNARLYACIARSCAVGFVSGAEYAVFDGCISSSCTRGFELDAGNVVWIGGDLSGNVTGVYQPGGGNDGHGVISGCTINHCTHPINIGAIGGLNNGMLFSDCDIYYGDITLKTTNGVKFAKCFIDVTDLYFDGSLGTVFDSCTWPLANANTIHNSYNGNASKTHWMPNNTTLAGDFPAFISAADDGSAWQPAFIGTGLATFGGSSSVSGPQVKIGGLVGDPTTYCAVYMLTPSTTATIANSSIYSEGNSLYFNLRSGSFRFKWQYGAATNVMVLDPTADVGTLYLSKWQFATSISAAVIGTSTAGASLKLQAGAAQDVATFSTTAALVNVLAGTGTRPVVSDASGNLSAPDPLLGPITNPFSNFQSHHVCYFSGFNTVSTGANSFGFKQLAQSGTIAQATESSGSKLNGTRRTKFSVTTATGQLGVYETFNGAGSFYIWRGDAAGRGGFKFATRAAVVSSGTSSQVFHHWGIGNFAGSPGFTNYLTSTTDKRIMLVQSYTATAAGAIPAATNWKISECDGTTNTLTDTGIPVTHGSLIEFFLYCAGGGANVSWQVNDITLGTSASGTCVTSQPSTTSFMCPGVHTAINVAGTGTNEIDVAFMYLELFD